MKSSPEVEMSGRVFDVGPYKSLWPRLLDLPLSEPMSASEVITLPKSESESVPEVPKKVVSVSVHLCPEASAKP